MGGSEATGARATRKSGLPPLETGVWALIPGLQAVKLERPLTSAREKKIEGVSDRTELKAADTSPCGRWKAHCSGGAHPPGARRQAAGGKPRA